MEVRLLTETTNVDDDDWLYVQKDNGLPRKVKKSNLALQVQQQGSQIITSVTSPSNPQLGMEWNQINSNNYFVQRWNYINNEWITNIKVAIVAQPSSSTLGPGRLYDLNVDTFDNARLQRLTITAFTGNTHTDPNYLQYKLERVTRNNNITSTQVLNTFEMRNIVQNSFFKGEVNLNVYNSKDTVTFKNMFRIAIGPVPNNYNTNFQFNACLYYYNIYSS